jgi:hypothetical protein
MCIMQCRGFFRGKIKNINSMYIGKKPTLAFLTQSQLLCNFTTPKRQDLSALGKLAIRYSIRDPTFHGNGYMHPPNPRGAY